MISVKLVSEVEFKIDSILQVVLEHLKELRKVINASQEELKKKLSTSQDKLVACREHKKDICTGQEELASEISDIKAAKSEFEETIRRARQTVKWCFGSG